jgi:hybrid cluster-associated redox disulfide protein
MPLKRFYNRDLPLDELMHDWPQTRTVFFRHKMLCVGCLVAPFHTVSDACAAYDLDVDTFYDELTATISPQPAFRII